MATYKFSVLPGVAAPDGAPALGLTNIRPTVPPAGRVKDLLDRMTGSYTAFQQARIAQTWFDLSDAGILAKLDVLCIRGLNLADDLLNWAGDREVINGGATHSAAGLVTNGTSTFVDLQWNTEGNYQLGDACLFVFPPTGSPGGHSFGRMNAGSQRTQINVGGSSTGARLNNGAGITPAHGGIRFDVLWSVTDRAGVTEVFRDGELMGSATVANSYGLPDPGIALGRDNTAYLPTLSTAFGYGAALSAAQFGVLSAAIRSMNQVI